MTATTSDVNYDPFDYEIKKRPHEVYRRLRDEAPLYYNEQHGFYALSRFEDVELGLTDRERFISGRGTTVDLIQSGLPSPPGLFINEDAPTHTKHRAIVSILFTPKSVNALEPMVRAYCARTFVDLAERGSFDFVSDLAQQIPMRVIGMLVGIPEEDQDALRVGFESSMQAPYDPDAEPLANLSRSMKLFEDYVDFRMRNPTDDIMTRLIQHEFEDETGTRRTLTRDEILVYLVLIASAGNDTTSRLIGWTGKVLADHPDQRRLLVEDRSLLNNTIEEVLRYEPPSYHIARYVATDVEMHGRTIPEGSALVLVPGAAMRDEREFPDPDVFDIRRKMGHTLVFGYGAHFCLGAALARLEGRVVLDEVLNRFPEWEVDDDHARLTPGYFTRGWETLPVSVAG